VEAAACYVGRVPDPSRDAKIALTAEGLYGVFIYIATAIVFVAVLGASLKTADPLTEYTSFADHIFGNAGWVKYLIGIPLIFALLLSVLNAIMGVARSLFQASEDRLIPKFFAHKNKHHVPDRAMFFNLVCAMVVACSGRRCASTSSPTSATSSPSSLALGYFLVRQFQPERISPFRLPGFFRWIAWPWPSSSPSTTSSAGGTRRTSWSARARAHPLSPGLRHRGRLRAAHLVAQDDRQAGRRHRLTGDCPSWWGRPAASTSGT
jgi:hypothetical protein